VLTDDVVGAFSAFGTRVSHDVDGASLTFALKSAECGLRGLCICLLLSRYRVYYVHFLPFERK
jgi:hypothetical protein